MTTKKLTKLIALYLPYILLGLVATNFGEACRLAEGKELGDKIMSMMGTVPLAFANPLPSLHPLDLLVGLCCGAAMRLAVYLKGKNAKKYRHGMEYGSARWGTPKDIEPFMAPKFEDNIILTKTERLMMSNRPPDPKNARNKNVLVVGGSGSGKTRFWLKPNLLQCHSSYVVTDPKNGRLFEQDSSYYLLCSLENLDEQGQLKSKAAMFTKRTIRPERTVTSVDTPSKALAVSIGEHGKVDLPYMAELLGTPGEYERITTELSGVIFKNPAADPTDPEAGWQMADEYLSGDVRAKLRMAQFAAETNPEFVVNVDALTKAQPRELEASEIDVRLGATWLDPNIIQKFMTETFQIPYYLRHAVKVRYSPYTAEWRVEGKTATGRGDIISSETYGTSRANAYKILEETLNLKDVRIYDTIEDAEGKPKRVLNKRETMLAQQKQQVIKDAFANWVWQDPQRRIALVKQYNELFNSTRPREYDGSHIHFVGMNPEITLREHQRNAIAHVLYGGNTLLAHEVGAGKTYEMAASAMEAKRLGLCQKSLFVVPNHLTEQWASEFLNLYPNAKLLVARRKDFETANRKKFCARIATGDYDAVIIGHSQFERIH